jgi:hypothetical protein
MTQAALDICLGKLKARHDDRTLAFANYTTQMSPPPPAVDVPVEPSPWGMLGNDRVGNCTVAGQAHTSMLWTALAGRPDQFSDRTVLNAYSKLTGYDPKQTDANGDNPTDTGAYLLDALKQWHKSGIGHHTVHSFAALDTHDVIQAQQAVYLTNTAYIGIDLPLTAADQTRSGQRWDVVTGAGSRGNPGTWGGHCVCLAGYDQVGPYFVSWGKVMQMTWRFWTAYVDEAYFVDGNDELRSNRRNPLGFNLAQLDADARAISGH